MHVPARKQRCGLVFWDNGGPLWAMMRHALDFLGIGILAAMLAVAAIIGTAMRIDKDPAVDGPRALITEFFGLWLAFTCLGWSFMIAGPAQLLWTLRGVAAGSALIAFTLAAYFAGTPEVRIRLDEEPSGFDNPTTGLQLNNTGVPLSADNDSQTHNRV